MGPLPVAVGVDQTDIILRERQWIGVEAVALIADLGDGREPERSARQIEQFRRVDGR